ncbi:hypothetical protein FGRMN_6770 [Fusarium graminum]|nr:hypothetical protein FGRMN_6770 [Fusarium graminum]
MNNNSASPYGLQVPVSSASPSGSNNTTTGRPPLWTSSSRRKVSRLYLYTTLPLEKIMAVVHAKSPDTPVPGKDSAHKTLNAMLNKQPRWLHPKTEEDMARRLDELALSPTRTSSTNNSVASPAQTAGPIPALNAIPTPHLVRHQDARVSLEVPPFNQYSQHQPQQVTNRSAAEVQMQQQQEESSTFRNFLHRPTFMTSSTDCTTGTLHRLLHDYPHPYVKTVKRLIKRYTAPLNRRGASLSPISDEEPSVASWLNDRDAPGCLPNKPHYLPGDFLCIDEFAKRYTCFPGTEDHMKLSCFCRPIREIGGDAWTAAQGISPAGMNVLSLAMESGTFDDRDQFDHTAFHLMAAKFMRDYLFQAILSVQDTRVLNAQNTAGQTLLHVLHDFWFEPHNEVLLQQLLDILAQKRFDFSARDHYGRSFSHILLLRDAPAELRNHLLGLCRATDYQKRDAFNVTPTYAVIPEPSMGISRAYTQAMDLDPPAPVSRQDGNTDPYRTFDISKETLLLRSVGEAQNNPRFEDSEGRNGLHCLAAAALSKTTVTQKYCLDEDGEPADRKPRKEKATKDLDSSTGRLSLRYDILRHLLETRVDPNHYDINGNTPLMAFVAQLPEDDDYKVGPEIIKTLINYGAQVNARNRAGETALHIAVRCGHKLAVKQLVESGASAYARDAAGRSVLEVADVKMKSLRGHDAAEYAHLEACRAWLSGTSGHAVQEPTVLQEWSAVIREDE